MEKQCGTCGHFESQKEPLCVSADLGFCRYPSEKIKLPAVLADCFKDRVPTVWKNDGGDCAVWIMLFDVWIAEVKQGLMRALGLKSEPDNFINAAAFKKHYYDRGVLPADVLAAEAEG